MKIAFNTVRENRKLLCTYLDEIPQEKLLTIPPTFNNNIWWNIAHVAVTHQLLLYKLSGLPLNLPDSVITKYSKGSFPDDSFDQEEFDLIRNNLVSLVDLSEKDFNNGLFKTYYEYKTSANITLKNVEDAIKFNMFHEGIHLGSILALRRAIGENSFGL
jgi:hypothetical protein